MGGTDDGMNEPLVGGKPKEQSWVQTGLRVWNGTIVVLAGIFMIEATIFFWLGMHAKGPNDFNITQTDGVGADVRHISQGKLEMGLAFALTIVAGSMTFLASTQCMKCCFENKFMRIFYMLFCIILVCFELLMVYIIVVIEQWDVFKKDADSVELASLSKTLKDCMWLLVPELVISVFMQIGAMVFHCAWRNEIALKNRQAGIPDNGGGGCCGICGSDEDENDPGVRYQRLFKTFSGGKEEVKLSEKHVQRLESMRSYYAQLYMENGLSVPAELKDAEDAARDERRSRVLRARDNPL